MRERRRERRMRGKGEGGGKEDERMNDDSPGCVRLEKEVELSFSLQKYSAKEFFQQQQLKENISNKDSNKD